jgi:hypothetical protein
MGNRNSEGEGMKRKNDDRKPAAPGLPIRLGATAKALRDRYRREWDELGISPPPFDESTGGCAWLAWWQAKAAELGIDPKLIIEADMHVAGLCQDTMLGLMRKAAPAGATPPAPQGFLPIGDLLDFLGITDTKRREAARKTLTRARRKAPIDDRLYKWDSDWGQSGRALYATNRAAELLKKYQS